MRYTDLILAEIIAVLGLWIVFRFQNRIKDKKEYFNMLKVVLLSCVINEIVLLFIKNYSNFYTLSLIIYFVRNFLMQLSVCMLSIYMYKNWNRLKSIADFFVIAIFVGYIVYNFFDRLNLYQALGVLEVVGTIFQILSITLILVIYIKDSYFKGIYGNLEFLALISLNIIGMIGTNVEMLYALILVGLILIILKRQSSNLNIKNFNSNSLGLDFPIWFLFIIASAISLDIKLIIFFVALILLKVMMYKYINIYEFNIALSYQYKEINEKLNQKLEEIINFNNDLENIVKERTAKLELKNEELYKIINIDPITRVANRARFITYLDEMLEASSDDSEIALFFIDLDRFKTINDWHGHDVGDAVLKDSADRIKRQLGEHAFLGRLGGDEFGVVIDKNIAKISVVDIAEKIVQEFRNPSIVNGKIFMSTVSIGIAIFPLNARRRIDLMKFADTALYKAKLKGRDRAVIYDRNLKREENRKLEIESKLKDGFYNGELFLNFQPQINLKDGNLVAIESLLRWENSSLGRVSPSEFVIIAEENGIIVQIGEFVLKNSLESIKYINEKYSSNIKIALNVSPKQFYEIDFLDNIDIFLDKYDVNPDWVEIEITENLAIRNEELVFSKLKRIKNRGISIAIDDFGTGYSSFSYIKKYPIDKLKIARELISGVSDFYEDYKMVKAIIFMCKELNIVTIAEGVEKSEQVDILNQLGCDIIQGYYYSEPKSLDDIEVQYFS